jgi:uncharacterized protein (DUF2252 family)
MRSAVEHIIRFNRSFQHEPSLKTKLEKMSASPFAFFRGTFHLFARDILVGAFRKWPCLSPAGPIIGDLHTENFGTFRAISREIVYDINDFDETTSGSYEYDLRRLATSLLLASMDNGHSLGASAVAAESCIQGYLHALVRLGKLKTRTDFENLKDRHEVRNVLVTAGERSRVEMMDRIAVESAPGRFVFRSTPNYLSTSEKERGRILAALPEYLNNCLAPEGAHPQRDKFQDAAFRIAGCGSLGRTRYAILLSKGEPEVCLETLRLIEWKDALDSSLDVDKPKSSKNRARDVVSAAAGFQLFPKRYLGYTTLAGQPMQAREIGANDMRFQPKQFSDPDRLQHASRIFGEITARDHLLQTIGKTGPREITQLLHGSAEERWVKRMVAFAVAYSDRTLDDFTEFCSRKDEIAGALYKSGTPATPQC